MIERIPPTPITHQMQNLPTSCCSAALAMILGKPASEVEEAFHVPYEAGLTSEYEYLTLGGVGFDPLGPNLRSILWDQVYLLAVPSLNLQATLHSVVVDTRFGTYKVYDPNQGREGRLYYTGEQTDVPQTVPLKHYIIDARITHAPWLGIYRE